ncbi:hypothetical protein AVEN_188959-1 [Araneus ventricosus]|uniref:Uncharacterized protein n=1 Tax=Araneus ventricosus TaxID=182803 RepID=A0A4Y2IK38_ARAVE|nr:hypothetical protein AVEN_188959-1 [Araneus ventricosus]
MGVRRNLILSLTPENPIPEDPIPEDPIPENPTPQNPTPENPNFIPNSRDKNLRFAVWMGVRRNLILSQTPENSIFIPDSR